MATNTYTPGVYNTEYYSGAQVTMYIGDTWVDEVVSLSYVFQQDRKPIYDYASPLFRDVSKGPVIIQGEFTINFKEAGYLWLVLDRYRAMMNGGGPSLMDQGKRLNHRPISGIRARNNPFGWGDTVVRQNIEQVVNGELDAFTRNRLLQDIAKSTKPEARRLADTSAGLRGFSSATRSGGTFTGRAEGELETFENLVWKKSNEELDNLHRRPDDPELNPFDIYVSYGDFAGDDSVNHTIRKIQEVYIVGGAQQVVIDGQPIQEAYSFIARNIV